MKNEAEARALLAMSTYHAIRDGTKYPGILLVHGVNDTRVDVWQTLKAASRFATATASGKPLLMRLEYDSGHGQGSTRAQSQARSADIWSFMLWQFGIPEFQPQAPAPASKAAAPASAS
jgi:prolyl oligopeptidase